MTPPPNDPIDDYLLGQLGVNTGGAYNSLGQMDRKAADWTPPPTPARTRDTGAAGARGWEPAPAGPVQPVDEGPRIDAARQTKQRNWRGKWRVEDKSIDTLRREGHRDFHARRRAEQKNGPRCDERYEKAERDLWGNWHVRLLTMDQLARRGTITRRAARPSGTEPSDPKRQVVENGFFGKHVRNLSVGELRERAKEAAERERKLEREVGPRHDPRTHTVEKDFWGNWYIRPLSRDEMAMRRSGS